MMRSIYETEDGEQFPMCLDCVAMASYTEGELYCRQCDQWYFVTHPDEELVIERVYDREPPGATQDVNVTPGVQGVRR